MGNTNQYEPPIVITKRVKLPNNCEAVYLEQDEGVYVAFLDENGKMIHLSAGAFYLTPACVEAVDEVKLVLSDAKIKAEKKEKPVKINGNRKNFNSKKDPVDLFYSRVVNETEKAILIFEELLLELIL